MAGSRFGVLLVGCHCEAMILCARFGEAYCSGCVVNVDVGGCD